jgi:hypothetical protein
VRELRKRHETKSNDMAAWKDRAEAAEHEHAVAAKAAEAAEAELDSYMRLHAATANIVLQRAEAAEAESAKLRDALEAVEEWWLTEGMSRFNGAPAAIFKVRAALGKE